MSTKPKKLTAQQKAAIETRDVSVALSAGAGCGKTFVLTRRFLEHLQPGESADPLAGIVAITFTDRAAREMRDRIRAACHDALENCAEDEVEHWLRILRGLDTARISTIHSFCAGLLRAHAVEAGIDPNFAVLEQASGQAFLRHSVSECLLELLAGHDDDCMQLVLEYGLERTQTVLADLVRGRFQIDGDNSDELTADELAERWVTFHCEKFVPARLADFAESGVVRRVVDLLQANEPSHAKMQSCRALLLEKLPQLAKADSPADLLKELQATAQVRGGGGAKAWDNADVYEEIKGAFERLRKAITNISDTIVCDDSEVQSAAASCLRAINVGRKIAEHYETQKAAAGVLDFDDLLLRTRNLLRDSKTARDAAQNGIEFLMVDEFQDTDPVQTDVVRLLCGDDLLEGRLFLVGDIKQSIYRFRRADPRVFTELRREFHDRGRLPLSTNFRSQPAVLDFVNCLFRTSMGEGYEELVPRDKIQHSPTPAIELLFATPDADGAHDSAEERRTREAEWIARRIRGLLDSDEPCIRQKDEETGEIGLRTAKPGDIAILFRSLSNVGLYEDALRRHGLDYYLVGGRAFYAQQEIYDLVNLCQYIDDPDDQISLVGVLRSPFFSLSDDTLFALFERARATDADSPSLARGLAAGPPDFLPDDQRRQAKHAAAVLDELCSIKDRVPLAELLSRAVESTGYDAALLTEFLGRRKVANLRKLIEMARQFDRAGLYTMKDFVVRLRESVLEEAQEELAATHPEKSDVIRLMTVHQSKGLEFPVVVVADTSWQPRGESSSVYFHPQLGPLLPPGKQQPAVEKNIALEMHRYFERLEDEDEYIRLFYVATTRAADYLILSAGLEGRAQAGSNSNRGLDRSPWMSLLAQKFDLDTGLPAEDPILGRITLGDVAPEHIPEIRVHHEPPEVKKSRDSEQRRVSPADFEQLVSDASPAPLPKTYTTIPPHIASREQISVSQLRLAAERERFDPSDAEGVSPIDDETHRGEPDEQYESIAAHELGTVVHVALERIDLADPGDVAAVVDASIATVPGAAGDDLRKVAIARVEALLQSEVARELASASRCFREIDFVLRWPIGESPGAAGTSDESLAITGQIDCLYQMADGRWRIVDYKTGRVPGGDIAAVREEYELQLLLYALAAREMIGRLPERAELVLVHEKVQRVAVDLNERTIGEAIRRIDRAVEMLQAGTP